MYQNQASYIAILPGLIRMTKKLSYSQTGKLGSPDLKDNFFILTPMRFIPLPGDSPLLFVSKSSFLHHLFHFLVILHYFMYPNTASYIAIHPGLIRMTKKLSYSQTGKLGSPSYIAIHPGLIRMTKKLSYSQTGKLGSPDLKVG
ncbi:hypothetical protein Bca4012_103848 [Brassica carinata]